MYIQCFIKKADGSPVFVDYEGVRYIFQHNQFGDAVCFVGNQMHVRRMLKMGPACYIEYKPPEEAALGTLLGAAPIPLGGAQKRERTNPLPDGLSVDDSLTQQPGDVSDPNRVKAVSTFQLTPAEQAKIEADRAATIAGGQPGPDPKEVKEGPETTTTEATPEASAVDWADEAKTAKIKEFKFLPKDTFKTFVDKNREIVPGWPEDVKKALAKKLVNLFPDDDPDIEGFDVNDYYGRGATINT